MSRTYLEYHSETNCPVQLCEVSDDHKLYVSTHDHFIPCTAKGRKLRYQETRTDNQEILSSFIILSAPFTVPSNTNWHWIQNGRSFAVTPFGKVTSTLNFTRGKLGSLAELKDMAPSQKRTMFAGTENYTKIFWTSVVSSYISFQQLRQKFLV